MMGASVKEDVKNRKVFVCIERLGMVDSQWLILALNLAEHGINCCSIGISILSALSPVS